MGGMGGWVMGWMMGVAFLCCYDIIRMSERMGSVVNGWVGRSVGWSSWEGHGMKNFHFHLRTSSVDWIYFSPFFL